VINSYGRELDQAQLDAVLTASGIEPGSVARWAQLGEATFNTAYRIKLADGRGLVLKVAPDPAMPLLAYEHDIMRTEALFYRSAEGVVPAPSVAHAGFSRTVVDSDFLLMSELPGANWYTVGVELGEPEKTRLRGELGRIVAALHTITGTEFGYPQGKQSSSWRTAFLAMFDAVLADSERFSVSLPRPVEQLRELVWGHADVLDAVDTPVLVHFDLWAGNILLHEGAVSGLVDAERAFWGDPLAEMVSVALFADIEQDPAFLGGYRAAGGSITFDEGTRTRLALYRCYLYLIKLVERAPRGYASSERTAMVKFGAPRGYAGPERRAMVKFITRHLNSALRALTP
jgi:aminoglycoside phosphotransferase (APT) family kinase protein